MKNTNKKPEVYLTSKPHYDILDGLRGVAAIMVVLFHLFETHNHGIHSEQIINHGYLAVDFFYVLSGFVIGYAYDDRWGKMSLGNFFKRRLVRLHPMIIMGMTIGLITFYFQAGPAFPGIADTPIWKLLLVFIIGCTLIPICKSLDFRGWTEMHPLDGPAWSLFYEYIANLIYGLFIHRFSKKWLAFLVFIFACVTIEFTTYGSKEGYIIGGWCIWDPAQVRIGLTRLLYPFFAGLLLSRVAKLKHYDHSFLMCSLLVIVLLSIPNIGGNTHQWMNGLYESLCIIVLFPLIVFMGASGNVTGKRASKVCRFLGDISYPLYITHYSFVYLYTSWQSKTSATIQQGIPMMILVFVVSITVAYCSMHFYDLPVRAWLKKKVFTVVKQQ
ncbi:MAG: acyltransferase [Bacteroidaceae bacterium]|nr:acyltransferase [Bacteroidaceae bacterium]